MVFHSSKSDGRNWFYGKFVHSRLQSWFSGSRILINSSRIRILLTSEEERPSYGRRHDSFMNAMSWCTSSHFISSSLATWTSLHRYHWRALYSTHQTDSIGNPKDAVINTLNWRSARFNIYLSAYITDVGGSGYSNDLFRINSVSTKCQGAVD